MSAGTYTVNYYTVGDDTVFPDDLEDAEFLEALSFGVAAGPPSPIPALGPWASMLLILTVMLLGIWMMRR